MLMTETDYRSLKEGLKAYRKALDSAEATKAALWDAHKASIPINGPRTRERFPQMFGELEDNYDMVEQATDALKNTCESLESLVDAFKRFEEV